MSTSLRQRDPEGRSDVHRTVHSIAVAAPAEAVYAIVADVRHWPQHFAPNLHTEQLERPAGPEPGAGAERIRIWALANGEVKSWTSRRHLDPRTLCVAFRQEVSQPPVATMGGEWAVTPTGPGHCRLSLHHDFTAVDDSPEGLGWITAAVDRNSVAELAGIRDLAERSGEPDGGMLEFEDAVHVAGRTEDVFDFLLRAEQWPQRLPHVARLDLREEDGGVQRMTMDTRTADGSVHTTESIRIVLGRDRIVYKQTLLPALMSAHTGSWTVRPVGVGVEAVSRHTVTVREDAVARVLGAGATVADARTYLHRALSGNSGITLAHAKAYAEALAGTASGPRSAHHAEPQSGSHAGARSRPTGADRD